MFLETFVALTIYLAADRPPYLHQGAGKIERIYNVTVGGPGQRQRNEAK